MSFQEYGGIMKNLKSECPKWKKYTLEKNKIPSASHYFYEMFSYFQTLLKYF